MEVFLSVLIILILFHKLFETNTLSICILQVFIFRQISNQIFYAKIYQLHKFSPSMKVIYFSRQCGVTITFSPILQICVDYNECHILEDYETSQVYFFKSIIKITDVMSRTSKLYDNDLLFEHVFQYIIYCIYDIHWLF